MSSTRTPVRLMVPVILFTALFFGTSGLSLAAHHETEETTASDVKEEAMQAYEVFKDYTLEQRDEAMAAAQEKLSELDQRIAELQEKIDQEWQKMSQATRQKTRASLYELRKKREDLAEWLGGIRYSSAEAWEEVKKGFVDSYNRMEEAFDQASKEIYGEQAK